MLEQWLVFSVFSLVLLWEYYRPKSKAVTIETRWLSNFSLTALAAALIYIVEASIVDLIPSSEDQGVVGYFNNVVTFIFWFALLDLFFYLCHRLSHAVPFLWKLHRVHHSDPYLDISTNFRHHPLSISGYLLC